jgi:hypothetical protein
MCLLLERRKKVVIYDRALLHPQLVLDEQSYQTVAVDQVDRSGIQARSPAPRFPA